MHQLYLSILLLSSFLLSSQKIIATEKRPTDFNIVEAKALSTQDYGEDIVESILFSFFEIIITEIAYDIFVESDLEVMLEESHSETITLQTPYLNNNDGRFTRNYNKDHFAMDLSGSLFYQNKTYNGANGALRLYVTPFFSLDGKYSYLRSDLNDLTGNDYAFLHANLLYHRFRFTSVDFWFGPGYTELISPSQNQYGANFQMGTEVYLFKPISLSTDWNFGFVDNTGVTQGNILLKAYLKQLYIEGGYQYYRVGYTKVEGPTIGLGYHFF